MRWRGKELVLLVVPALLVAAPGRPQSIPAAERPHHKIGDSFDVADSFVGVKCKHWVVTDLDRGGYLIFRCQDKLAYFAADHGYALSEIVTDKGQVLASYRPYLPPLPWPLTLGKKWSGRYDGYTLHGGHSWHATSRCEVKAIEPLPIGGHSVWTYRYDCVDDWRSGLFWGSADTEEWYAPAAEMVVKAVWIGNPKADWQVVNFSVH